MSLKHLVHIVMLAGFALIPLRAYPEDVDIFGARATQAASAPNILVFLDNTSNWSNSKQGWDKSAVYAKCNGNATCQGYVNQIFGSQSSLTQGQVEVSTLKLVLNQLVCQATQPLSINLGLMLIQPDKGAYSNDSGSQTDNSAVSGIIRKAVLPLNSTRCASILGDLDTLFNNITSPTYKAAANANYGGAMFEAFKYFGGYTKPANAHNNSPSIPGDGAGSPTGHIHYGPTTYTYVPSNSSLVDPSAFADVAKTTYTSPINSSNQSGCGGKNYLLLVGNAWPNGDDATLLSSLGYSYTASAFASASGSQPRLGDVWAKFLFTTDVSSLAGQQPVYTYVINVYNNQPDASLTTLLKSMARNGGGGTAGYYEVGGDLSALINSFTNFLTSINSVNTVFAASALPVSVNVRGTYLNQVYMGMFRPDENPRWFGNLKLFQLAVDPNDPSGNNVIMVDSTGNTEVTSSTTGFIVDSAISFWTHGSSFWNYRCTDSSGVNLSGADPLLCGKSINGSSLGSDSPDGAVVEKGAAGQMLREAFTSSSDASNSSRELYTCIGCATGTQLRGTTTTLFGTTNTNSANTTGITTTALGLSQTDNAQRDAIINWVRGVDNTSLAENTNAANRARPSMPGDVLHTRPVIVNYNATASGCSDTSNLDKDVMAYYAGNDGLLHAIKGGKNDIANAGKELWGFVPPEFFAYFKRLRDNAPAITFPAPVPAGANNKPYMIDGSLSVYAKDANKDCRLTAGSGDAVYLFITLRRGGRVIYGLDVTDKTNPKFLWKRSNTDTGYEELGQTWSQLTPILLRNGTAAVIFGAGYDPGANDISYNTATGSYSGTPSTPSMGRGVFVVDAANGNIIRRFGVSDGMTSSIPSDVAVLTDRNTDYVSYAYVGDTGGNVWKMDLTSSTPANWTVTKLASLGDPTDSNKTGVNARKFLYPPDVVRITGGYGILIGSGDREKPLDTTARNRFYMVKDSDSFRTPSNTYPFRCEGNESSCDLFNATNDSTVPSTAKGWYFTLGTGEKTVGSAATVSGTTYFPTNLPPTSSSNSCTANLGTAFLYGVNYKTGAGALPTGRKDQIEGGGFPPSPTPVIVQLSHTDASSNVTTTKNYKAVISGTKVYSGGTSPVGQRTFVYWFKEALD